MSTTTKEIQIEVTLDEKNIPQQIAWGATDASEEETLCRAMFLSLWDHSKKDTLRLDLWTQKMSVEEMKIFVHQTLVTMADTVERATGDERISEDMRDFCDYFARRMEIADEAE